MLLLLRLLLLRASSLSLHRRALSLLVRSHRPHPQLRHVLLRRHALLGRVGGQLLALLLGEVFRGHAAFGGFGGHLLLQLLHGGELFGGWLARGRHLRSWGLWRRLEEGRRRKGVLSWSLEEVDRLMQPVKTDIAESV